MKYYAAIPILVLFLSTATQATTVLVSPNLLKPNNGTNLPLKKAAKFTWQKVTGAKKYRLIFSNDESFANYDANKFKCLNKTTCFLYTVASPSYSVAATHAMLKAEGNYFWEVQSVGKTSATSSKMSEIRSFSVGTPLPPAIESMSANPLEVTLGNAVTIKATLDRALTAGFYSINISFDGSEPHSMTGSGTNFSFNFTPTEIGESQFQIDILDADGNFVDSNGDSFSVIAVPLKGLSWNPEVKIDLFPTGSVAGGSPKIAVDSSGNVMAVWAQTEKRTNADGTNSYINNIYANRYVMGKGWGTATVIDQSDYPADNPQIGVDSSGNFIAVWHQAWNTVNGTNYGIYASRYSVANGWQKPTTLFADTNRTDISANGDIQLAVDSSGNAVAVWSVYDWSWNHTSVRANRYISGNNWSGTENLSTESVQAAFSPNVAMDNKGGAMVVWSQESGTSKSSQGIQAVKYTAGSGWGTPKQIEDKTVAATRSGSAPQIVFDANGNAIAAWYQYGEPGIFATRYTPSAGWETAQAILDVENTSYDDGVKLAIDNDGNAMAIWNQSGGKLYANRYIAEQGWGETEIVDPNGADYSEQIAFDSQGNAVAVWGNYSCNSYNIMASRYVTDLGWDVVKQCWEANPSFVNKTLDYNREPQMVIDNAGNITVVWVRGQGGIGSIFATTMK